MHIRRAQLHELPILESLARQIWPSTYAHIISQAQIDFMLNWMYSFAALKTQFEAEHEFFILQAAGLDSGFMALESVKLGELSELKINKLYVLPSLQGKGAGRALINKAIERAKANQASSIFLQVNKANEAKNFYLKLGFEIREEAVFDIGHGFIMDDYIMALAL
jgi:ribosomal protein S18 acetylase RimI-like enzyme